jgi:hypothetical protein
MELDKKKEILLLMLNKILENSQKPKIREITDFWMERDELISEGNESIMVENYDYIFSCYTKDLSHYRRASAKQYIVILLKNMCKQSGFNLIKKMKDKGVTVGNDKYRKKVTTYKIE